MALRFLKNLPSWEEEEEAAAARKDVLWDEGVHDVHVRDIGGDLDRDAFHDCDSNGSLCGAGRPFLGVAAAPPSF
uniref:Uncharacterized protein n=1 Tax=Salix viminalis TaxID=40686 RepID=A0A6N2NGX9_SALVM